MSGWFDDLEIINTIGSTLTVEDSGEDGVAVWVDQEGRTRAAIELDNAEVHALFAWLSKHVMRARAET